MRQEIGAIRLGREQHEVGHALGHHGGDLDQIIGAVLAARPQHAPEQEKGAPRAPVGSVAAANALDPLVAIWVVAADRDGAAAATIPALVTTPLVPTPLPVPAALLIATPVIARINLNATRTNREALRRGSRSRAGAERQGKNKTPY